MLWFITEGAWDKFSLINKRYLLLTTVLASKTTQIFYKNIQLVSSNTCSLTAGLKLMLGDVIEVEISSLYKTYCHHKIKITNLSPASTELMDWINGSNQYIDFEPSNWIIFNLLLERIAVFPILLFDYLCGNAWCSLGS